MLHTIEVHFPIVRELIEAHFHHIRGTESHHRQRFQLPGHFGAQRANVVTEDAMRNRPSRNEAQRKKTNNQEEISHSKVLISTRQRKYGRVPARLQR